MKEERRGGGTAIPTHKIGASVWLEIRNCIMNLLLLQNIRIQFRSTTLHAEKFQNIRPNI